MYYSVRNGRYRGLRSHVFSDHKRIEKLRYMHGVPGAPDFGVPVKRGLAEKPEDWKWSSYRHYLT